MKRLTVEDLRWLDAAVRIATPQLGATAENPTIATLIVDPTRGVLIGSAVTAIGGRPHAEPQALEAAGAAARGATVYTTLEPCRHWGRTPPCVDGLIRAAIGRIVIGQRDPDPRTNGASLEKLASAGIEVVLADHAVSRRLHEAHFVRMARNRPFVTVKLELGRGDRLSRPGASASAEALAWTQLVRAMSNAVLVGAATAQADNPALTVEAEGIERRTPWRIVLCGQRGVMRTLNLIGGFTGYRVAVIAVPELELDVPASIEVLRVPGEALRPNLAQALAILAGRGVSRLLVESGPTLADSLLSAGLVDRVEVIRLSAAVAETAPASATTPLIDRLITAGLSQTASMNLGQDRLDSFDRF